MRMSAHAVRGEGKFQMVKKKTKMRLPRESQRLRTFSTIACSTILAFMAVVGGTKGQPPPPQKNTPGFYEKTKKKNTPPIIRCFQPGSFPPNNSHAQTHSTKIPRS